MAILSTHLRDLVIRPALEGLKLYSKAAEMLLLGTCAQESACGKYLKQLGTGPAIGIFQMEPATHDWMLTIAKKHGFTEYLKKIAVNQTPETMGFNLKYAAAMCRLRYFVVKEALPQPTVEDCARYWKKYYNTYLGKGTEPEFIQSYKQFIGDI